MSWNSTQAINLFTFNRFQFINDTKLKLNNIENDLNKYKTPKQKSNWTNEVDGVTRKVTVSYQFMNGTFPKERLEKIEKIGENFLNLINNFSYVIHGHEKDFVSSFNPLFNRMLRIGYVCSKATEKYKKILFKKTNCKQVLSTFHEDYSRTLLEIQSKMIRHTLNY